MQTIRYICNLKYFPLAVHVVIRTKMKQVAFVFFIFLIGICILTSNADLGDDCESDEHCQQDFIIGCIGQAVCNDESVCECWS